MKVPKELAAKLDILLPVNGKNVEVSLTHKRGWHRPALAVVVMPNSVTPESLNSILPELEFQNVGPAIWGSYNLEVSLPGSALYQLDGDVDTPTLQTIKDGERRYVRGKLKASAEALARREKLLDMSVSPLVKEELAQDASSRAAREFQLSRRDMRRLHARAAEIQARLENICNTMELADAGQVDAGQVDAGQVDAGQVDAGQVDAGQVDAGKADAGQVDAGKRTAMPRIPHHHRPGKADAGKADAGKA